MVLATAADRVRFTDAKFMPMMDNVPAPVFGPFWGVRADCTGESKVSSDGCELATPATVTAED